MLNTALALIAGATAAQAMDAKAAYGKLPLAFEKNEGQVDRAVQYLARGRGYTLFLAQDEAVLVLRQSAAGANLRLRVAGGNPHSRLVPQNPLTNQVNYLRGNDPKNWHARIGTWQAVKYEQVYPGIDLVFYGNQGQLEFDFVAAPSADASLIRFQVGGARAVVDSNGDVILTVGTERVKMQKPVVYQEGNRGRQTVDGRFVVAAPSNEISFSVGAYDRTRPLVIDPTLLYASYLGGTQENSIQGIAVNAAGEAFVTGITYAANFPTTSGTVQSLQPGCAPGDCTLQSGSDAFVARISADGTQLLYSTYLGGNNEDAARAIAVDAAGNAYVTGYTFSNDFPVMNPYQKLCNPRGVFNFANNGYTGPAATCEQHPAGEGNVYSQNQPDVFITKLDPTGGQILYSTFFGGSGNDNASAIALDAAGNIYIAGSTSSVGRSDNNFFPNGYDVAFPVTATAYEDGRHGTQNFNYFLSFVAKFSSDGGTLLYSSTFGGPPGGTVAEYATSMAVGSNGFVTLAGNVTSDSMPTKNAIQANCASIGSTVCNAGFLAAFDTTQSGDASLVYATYLGGAVPRDAGTNVYGLATDAQNNVYATGNSAAHDFLSTPGSFHPGCTTPDATRFCQDAFVFKVDATGALVWATNYGNGVPACPQITGHAITTDANGNVYFAGNTAGCGVPLNNWFQNTVPGANAFVSVLSADGSNLLFGSIYGGSGAETPNAIALDANGNIFFAGSTSSGNLPGTGGSLQPNYGGGAHNGFIAKISPLFIASSTVLTADPNPANLGDTITLTAVVTGQEGHPIPTGSVTFYSGSTALMTSGLDANGMALFSTSALAGNYQFTAAYGGDGVYFSSSSAAILEVVNGATAAVTGAVRVHVTKL